MSNTVSDIGKIDISVILPVFNEEENIVPMASEIESALAKAGRSFEIIFVDDKSTDGSLEVMKKLKDAKPFVRVIPHLVNSGQSAAIATGFEHARGGVVVTMDSDMQNDPSDIPALVEALKDDVAAVCGVRRKRMDSAVKRISSKTANAFRNMITGDKVTDAGCSYRAIRRSALWQVQVFNGMHRFLPTLLRFQGYKVVEMDVNHRPRIRGLSKYGIGNRLWRGILDCFAICWMKKRMLRGDRIGQEYGKD